MAGSSVKDRVVYPLEKWVVNPIVMLAHNLGLHTDDLGAEVARLEELGAERMQQVHSGWILRDPAGLPFRVLPEPVGSLNDSDAQRRD